MEQFSKLVNKLSIILLVGLFGCALWLSWNSGRWNGQTTDSVDTLLQQYSAGPERVLVTYPGATELLIDLGLANRIVGTVAPYGVEPECYREAYAKLPIVTAPYVPSREEVAHLQPDMIIGWSHHFEPNALGHVQNWRDKGVYAYIVPATERKGKPTVESTVYPFIDSMGRIFHVVDRAEAYKAKLMARVERVEQARKLLGKTPNVLILQDHGRSTYSLYGPIYIIDDIVRKAGGNNLVDRQLSQVGPERVLAFDPDYIIYVATSPDVSSNDARINLMHQERLQHMRAIQDGKVIVVPFSDVNNGNGRVVDALETISKGFQEVL